MVPLNDSFNRMDDWEQRLEQQPEWQLADQKISDTDIITLSKILKKSTNVVSIDLRNNKITCEGARALAEALLVNTTFARRFLWDTQVLKLSGNSIKNSGLHALYSACQKSNRSPEMMCIAKSQSISASVFKTEEKERRMATFLYFLHK